MGTTRCELVTDDGVRLEAEVAEASTPMGAVVLAHPHPAMGGTMRSGIVDWLFAALPGRGLTTVRFNFRGVGRSTGRHDEGKGERRDVAAAVAEAAQLVEGRPVVAAGWSFGADVSLGVDHPAIAAWCGIAPTLAALDVVAGLDPRPTLLLVPAHDQHAPPDAVRAATVGWTSTSVEVLEGCDHFLAGAAAVITERVVAFAAAVSSGSDSDSDSGSGRPA